MILRGVNLGNWLLLEMWQLQLVRSALIQRQQINLVARESVTSDGMAREMQALIRRWS